MHRLEVATGIGVAAKTAASAVTGRLEWAWLKNCRTGQGSAGRASASKDGACGLALGRPNRQHEPSAQFVFGAALSACPAHSRQ